MDIQSIEAINENSKKGDSKAFIEFTLQAICNTLKNYAPEVAPEVVTLLKLLRNQVLCRKEIQVSLHLKDEKNIRLRYFQPALQAEMIAEELTNFV